MQKLLNTPSSLLPSCVSFLSLTFENPLPSPGLCSQCFRIMSLPSHESLTFRAEEKALKCLSGGGKMLEKNDEKMILAVRKASQS